MRNDLLGTLPFVSAKHVMRGGWVTCPNCKKRHGLFYRRKGPDDVTLNFLCDKVVRYNAVNKYGDMDRERLGTSMGQCEFVAGLPIREEWAPKYRKQVEQEQQGSLLK